MLVSCSAMAALAFALGGFAVHAGSQPQQEFVTALQTRLPTRGVLEVVFDSDDPTGKSLLRMAVGIDFSTGHFYCAYANSFLGFSNDGSPFAMEHKQGAWRPVDTKTLFVAPDPAVDVVLAPLLLDIRRNPERILKVASGPLSAGGSGWIVDWSVPSGILSPSSSPPGAPIHPIVRRIEIDTDLHISASYIQQDDGKWVLVENDYSIDDRAPAGANVLVHPIRHGGAPLKIESLSWTSDRQALWTPVEFARITKRVDTRLRDKWAIPQTTGGQSQVGNDARGSDSLSAAPGATVSRTLITCGAVVLAIGVFAWVRRRNG